MTDAKVFELSDFLYTFDVEYSEIRPAPPLFFGV